MYVVDFVSELVSLKGENEDDVGGKISWADEINRSISDEIGQNIYINHSTFLKLFFKRYWGNEIKL